MLAGEAVAAGERGNPCHQAPGVPPAARSAASSGQSIAFVAAVLALATGFGYPPRGDGGQAAIQAGLASQPRGPGFQDGSPTLR
jgi:hypothetical protein